MTIDEAIDIAWGSDKARGVPRPTPEEALESIGRHLATCGFNWLTGQEARRVLHEACTPPTFPRKKRPMATATLTVDIDYDPTVTDPEAIASAADRLMETVLSTPGIMDEYGNPLFGEFSVLSAAMPMLVAACQAVVATWENGDLAKAARSCAAAVKVASMSCM